MSEDKMLARMVRLLHGDKAAVKRLVTAAMNRHPGKPSRWYVQKALWDLERDRGLL